MSEPNQTPNTGVVVLVTVDEISLDLIQPNPNQPRKQFGQDSLEGLASSIRKSGVLMPILVTKKGEDGKHVIIAGERRWRATGLTTKKTIPCIVRDVKPEDIYDMSATENLTREDMTPFEEATVYKVKLDAGSSQAEIGTLFGKERSHITNMIGLLDLPKEVTDELSKKDSPCTMGHARALKGLKDHPEALMALFQRTMTDKVSVRFVEEQVKEAKAKIAAGVPESEAANAATLAPKDGKPRTQGDGVAPTSATGTTPGTGEGTQGGAEPGAVAGAGAEPEKTPETPTHLLELQKALRNALRTDVKIVPTTGGEFQVRIQAFGNPDLARLAAQMGVKDDDLLNTVKNIV